MIVEKLTVVDAYVASRTLVLGLGRRAKAEAELEEFLKEERLSMLRLVATTLSGCGHKEAAALVRELAPVAAENLGTVTCLCGATLDGPQCRANAHPNGVPHPVNQRKRHLAPVA